MALTPLAMYLAEAVTKPPSDDLLATDTVQQIEGEQALMVVVGCGRVGQIMARVLRRRGHRLLLIDANIERVRVALAQSHEVLHGRLNDATLDLIEGRGVRAFFVCAEAEASLESIMQIRQRFPDVLVLARTDDRLSQWEAMEIGADDTVRTVFESALSMARLGLQYLGDGDAAEEIIEDLRREDADRFRALQVRFARDKPTGREES